MSSVPPHVDADKKTESLQFPESRDVATDNADATPKVADEAIAAIESMSRRIDDLARELNCLGFFDDDDDRPRAA